VYRGGVSPLCRLDLAPRTGSSTETHAATSRRAAIVAP
jgi:hypothetical protein